MTSNTAGALPALATVGISRVAQAARERAEALSQIEDPILFVGPASSGKSSLARAIHRSSNRGLSPFVVVPCKWLSAGAIFESQIFGHLPGAFAGLRTSSLGLLRAADGGTVFLKEVDYLDVGSQKRLMAAIQNRTVVPLGGIEAIPFDARVMASTCQDLPIGVSAGTFDTEMGELLAANVIETARLVDRLEDLPALVECISRENAARHQTAPKQLTASALDWIAQQDWPGNLADLTRLIEIAWQMTEEEEIDDVRMRQALLTQHATGVAGHRITTPTHLNGRNSLPKRRR